MIQSLSSDHPLTKNSENSGYEIGIHLVTQLLTN